MLIHGAIGAFWRFPLDGDTPAVEPIEFIVVDPSPIPEVTPPPTEQKTEQKKPNLCRISPHRRPLR
ncbi:hypothetical protein NON20_09750 [Synechocystis sp. B12]|nr:hypothetical protein NON20_09750 [Synechocystis sp. B12]